MKPLWDRFILATGKTDELTKKITKIMHQVIWDFPEYWPSRIILGKETIKDTAYDAPDLKGFYNGFGEILPIDIVEGDEIQVWKEKLT